MEEEVGTNNHGGGAVVKGKRTKRHRPNSVASASDTNKTGDHQEAEEAAASSDSNYSSRSNNNGGAAPIASASDRFNTNTEEEEDMANCLIMLAQGRRFPEKFTSRRFLEGSPNSSTGYYVYECKTCSKTFPSFQALGGHRASHKKPKLQPSATTATIPTKDEESNSRRSNNIVLSDDDETTTNNNPPPPPPPPPAIKVNHSITNNNLSLQLTNRALYNNPATTTGNKQRVHECSICGAEFASGQALGGHMRRHRGPAIGGSQPAPIATASSLSLTLHVEEDNGEQKRSSSSSALHPNNKKPSLDLDLNLPAMPDSEEVKLVFTGKKPQSQATQGEEPQHAQQQQQPAAQAQKQPLVFSPPALVDCHY